MTEIPIICDTCPAVKLNGVWSKDADVSVHLAFTASHGKCPACVEAYRKSLQELKALAAPANPQ